MNPYDWLILWHDFVLLLTGFAVLVFVISGLEDFFYDIAAYAWSLYKYVFFANRKRLTFNDLTAREQQQIAVMVPAWQESDVIGKMVENILLRVNYRNYVVFVGTYPNDLATQHAVDALAVRYPQVIKVVTTRPGPTNKADNLNQVYRTIKAYEQAHGITFDIFVMHDAEDLVHPYSFLLYNYLIPRAEIIQLPILPLPMSHLRWTHWVYADEFTENHMKDVIVREITGGFVPFAGVGTGFSRRALAILEQETGQSPFNEGSLTEDYSLSLRVSLHNIKSIFVRLLLADDNSPWYTPLSQRPGFIANWAYFPADFTRSVRQKTRWIMGISLQEWEHVGWEGPWRIRENLFKDRKVFIASMANLCGYITLLYSIVVLIGKYIPGFVAWIPVLGPGNLLYILVLIASWLMVVRLVQRFILVGIMYGPVAGLLSAPRMVYANIIAILASFRAMHTFAMAKAGKAQARWDKTDHQEGVGELPSQTPAPEETGRKELSVREAFLPRLRAEDPQEIITGLEAIPREPSRAQRRQVLRELEELAGHPHHRVRAMLARCCGFLRWPETVGLVSLLLHDAEWIVRANAARALLKFPDFPDRLAQIFAPNDRYARDIIIRELEQNDQARQHLFNELDRPELAEVREVVLHHSRLAALVKQTKRKRERAVV